MSSAPPSAPGAALATTPVPGTAHRDRYKWTVLVNTTVGVFMAMMNTSVVIISLPAIFRGIHVNPLQASNIGLLLWLLMSYMVVTAVLVVTFGRIGDLFGRVRMYNAGFAVFTVGSILLAVSPVTGPTGALVLIGLRVVQGIGGALLMANSMAIITDAFPVNERGMALGINIVAGISGSFLGLLVGGLLADLDWRLVFLVSVPFGVAGTIWAYLKLHDTGVRRDARVDWWGNATFALGLVLVLVGLTYGLMPYGGHSMGWTSPSVLAEIIGGIASLGLFVFIESKVEDPMFHLGLFRIRAFVGAGVANLLSNMGRGGLQFMLILWLQGIWLPLHGYSFAATPLWSGIYLVPMSIGYLLSGPLAGRLSDRQGQKWYSTVGMLGAAATFLVLLALPVNFPYPAFAAIVLANGVCTGLFAAPNTTTLMNAVPPGQRGAASGMRATFMNAGFVLSISIFFSLMIVGLATTLPHAMFSGLTSQGVPASVAHRVAGLPPVGTLFAAFLGYNPIGTLLGPNVLAGVGPAHAATVTGKAFFPSLISGPFHHGLIVAFTASAALCALAGLASLWAGDEPYDDPEERPVPFQVAAVSPAGAPSSAAPSVAYVEADEAREAEGVQAVGRR
ncbi:MAG TPA: MFS transporter [Acidimicrobiaceae bacterium]|nr:MFS transporter [Acidimicrobiaceae bacterium]